MTIEDDVRCALTRTGLAGSVQSHLVPFATELIGSGFSSLSAEAYLRSAAHFGQWLEKRRVALDEVSDESVACFARHRCACEGRHSRAPSRRSVAHVWRFVHLLECRGVVAPASVVSPLGTTDPLAGFRAWLAHHRGLTPRTIRQYASRVESMLPALGTDPGLYSVRLVRQVVLAETRDRHSAYAKTFVTALRSFLRFHASQGSCPRHLDRAVPAIRVWKLSALPRFLEAEAVEQVIASCSLNSSQGIRDRAVLLLLARLGLRAADIVDLQIRDLDWAKGTVRVLGKAKNQVRLPLPQDAGDALVDYLQRARPRSDHGCVFLCLNAPFRPFATSATVSMIVRLAIEKAGIPDPPSKGAHLLRHSAATAMLRSGASLDAVATILRHESSDMTAHYAKVDISLLECVAQPWPEGA
jgi:integrase/recombinase XerD